MYKLLLFVVVILSSCTNVKIHNKSGEEINKIVYNNTTVYGTIVDKTFIPNKNNYHYDCYIKDDVGNEIEINMSFYLFDSDKNPKIGDRVKLIFIDDGEKCKVYKNTKSNPKSFIRVCGGGTGGLFSK